MKNQKKRRALSGGCESVASARNLDRCPRKGGKMANSEQGAQGALTGYLCPHGHGATMRDAAPNEMMYCGVCGFVCTNDKAHLLGKADSV